MNKYFLKKYLWLENKVHIDFNLIIITTTTTKNNNNNNNNSNNNNNK